MVKPLRARVFSKLTGTTSFANDLWSDGYMTFNGTNAVRYERNTMITDGNKWLYPTATSEGTTSVIMGGLYPADIWGDFTGGKFTTTIDGRQDVMRTNLLVSNATDASFQILEFQHRLTLLNLDYKKEPDVENIEITELKLIGHLDVNEHLGVTNQVTIDFDGEQTSFTRLSASLDVWKRSDDSKAFATSLTVNTSATDGHSYIIAPPIEGGGALANDYEYTFQIKYFDGTVEKIRNVNIDLMKDVNGTIEPFTGQTRGYAFHITFVFTSGEIQARATVTDWKMAGSWEVNL